jgi:hypothetical protein
LKFVSYRQNYYRIFTAFGEILKSALAACSRKCILGIDWALALRPSKTAGKKQAKPSGSPYLHGSFVSRNVRYCTDCIQLAQQLTFIATSRTTVTLHNVTTRQGVLLHVSAIFTHRQLGSHFDAVRTERSNLQ